MRLFRKLTSFCCRLWVRAKSLPHRDHKFVERRQRKWDVKIPDNKICAWRRQLAKAMWSQLRAGKLTFCSIHLAAVRSCRSWNFLPMSWRLMGRSLQDRLTGSDTAGSPRNENHSGKDKCDKYQGVSLWRCKEINEVYVSGIEWVDWQPTYIARAL